MSGPILAFRRPPKPSRIAVLPFWALQGSDCRSAHNVCTPAYLKIMKKLMFCRITRASRSPIFLPGSQKIKKSSPLEAGGTLLFLVSSREPRAQPNKRPVQGTPFFRLRALSVFSQMATQAGWPLRNSMALHPVTH
jgi:hypothetical protein